MFQFIEMIDNYAQRKVARWENDDGSRMVSTARVNDGLKEFETAFMHPIYNGGSMVIVEGYDTYTEALAGHGRWVEVMTVGPLPRELFDISNSEIARMCDAIEKATAARAALAKARA